MDGFFVVSILIKGRTLYTLLHSVDDIDRFHLDNGKMKAFDDVEGLWRYIADNGLELYKMDGVEKGEPFAILDIDKLSFWVKHPNKHIDTTMCLNAWNYASDLDATIPFGFDKYQGKKVKKLDRVYDKLFAAQNHPAFSSSTILYKPTWKQSEVLLLRDVMRDAIAGFRKFLQ